MNLRWERRRIGDTYSWVAYCGQVRAGHVFVTYQGFWGYEVYGIDVKWITRRDGTVSRKRTAVKAVERAWEKWALKAGFL